MAAGKRYKRFAGPSVNNAGYHNENWDKFHDGNELRDVSYDSFAEAITYIGTSSSKTLYITTQHRITSSRDIHANISIVVLKGGSFDISSGVTLTINGPFSAHLGTVFTGSGTTVFARGVVDFVRSEWFGVTWDNSTNDATAFQAAIDATSTAYGVLRMPGKTAFFGTTQINLKSNMTLIGEGAYATTLRWSAASGNIDCLVAASSVSKFELGHFGVSGYMGSSPVRTNSAKGIKISGTKFRVHDLLLSECYFGIITDATARWGRIYDIDLESTTGQTDNGIVIRSSKNVRVNRINAIGVDANNGFNHAVNYENGGTIHGARHCRIAEVDADTCNSWAVGGYVDNFVTTGGADANYNYKNLTIQSSGYTSAISTDIGKTVTGGTSGATGTLKDYDNTARIWCVLPVNGTPFQHGEALTIGSGTGAGTIGRRMIRIALVAGFTACVSTDISKTVTGGTSSATGTLREYDNSDGRWVVEMTGNGAFVTGEALTISTGTGTGTTDGGPTTITFSVLDSPSSSDSFINNNSCSNVINGTVGSGIAVDGCVRNIVAMNIANENGYCGIFVGDNDNQGTIVGFNIARKNGNTNLAFTRSNNMVVIGNNSSESVSSGYRVEPTIAGATDRMMFLGNMAFREGSSHGSDQDSGMSLAGEQIGAVGNALFQNYRHGLNLLNLARGLVSGNLIADNDNNKTSTYSGIFADGATRFMAILGNAVTGALGFQRQKYSLNFTTNARENMAMVNFLMGAATSNYQDAGSRNALNGNIGDATDAILLSQVANTGIVSLQYVNQIGFLFVFESVSNSFGCYLIRGASNAVVEAVDPYGTFTTTSGNANTCNIYYSSGYKLENRLGSTANFKLQFIGIGA